MAFIWRKTSDKNKVRLPRKENFGPGSRKKRETNFGKKENIPEGYENEDIPEKKCCLFELVQD